MKIIQMDNQFHLDRCVLKRNDIVSDIIDRQKTGANSSYKKLAVQGLNEILCFVSSSMVAGSFVLRKRQLLVAANRLLQL